MKKYILTLFICTILLSNAKGTAYNLVVFNGATTKIKLYYNKNTNILVQRVSIVNSSNKIIYVPDSSEMQTFPGLKMEDPIWTNLGCVGLVIYKRDWVTICKLKPGDSITFVLTSKVIYAYTKAWDVVFDYFSEEDVKSKNLEKELMNLKLPFDIYASLANKHVVNMSTTMVIN